MAGTATAQIDLAALRHNLQVVRSYLDGQKIIAMVKADAYGHGLLEVAEALQDVDAFGVANLAEAMRLREAGFKQRIILNSGCDIQDEWLTVSEYGLDAVVHSHYQIDQLRALQLLRPITVWLKIDTGMNRLGFPPAQAATVFAELKNLKQIADIKLMTHLACADDLEHAMTQRQLSVFATATKGLEAEKSIARSAAIVEWPEALGDWVRPGIMLYGASPVMGRSAADYDLRPVMRLSAPLIAIKALQAGDTVGYGGSWVAPEAMPIGIVAIGYGDGYPRHASSVAPVWLNGVRTQVLGRVSMDSMAIDLRPVPTAAVLDSVELWGQQLLVDDVANAVGTISYELVTQLGSRVEFFYHHFEPAKNRFFLQCMLKH